MPNIEKGAPAFALVVVGVMFITLAAYVLLTTAFPVIRYCPALNNCGEGTSVGSAASVILGLVFTAIFAVLGVAITRAGVRMARRH